MISPTPQAQTRRPTAADGFVVVDKPQGWTSHDVVGRVRRLAGTRKVGHAGTLDPMATGVLVLGVGKATRLLTYVVGADKDYDATIRLGVATTTDDAEGTVVVVADPAAVEAVEQAALDAAVTDLTGDILQVPTSVSAVKVDGKRAYARVRAGEDVTLQARPVTVSRFDVLDVRRGTATVPAGGPAEVYLEGPDEDGAESGAGSGAVPGVVPTAADPGAGPVREVPVIDVDVRVTVSSGTYVRALARDLGAALGTGGHLTVLRRTRVGGYDLSGARTLEDMERQADADGTLATLPLADAARGTFPVRELDDVEVRALGYGQWVEPSGRPEVVAALSPAGALVALLEDTRRRGESLAKPVLVLAPAP
ncbi:tRNA pseudouridine(55) synthase TruB [Promicromonospora citrea]|uniref:tRNA pseudouridine synthase B n=1 Tax=Promicromonospora citrea TaxID=43677 RepID=A0A8H9L3K8_9MICO|nr:tRNA pseudouridine(55) synthase TruB [Promicromonospora citrea]NNH54841.1 tRNA pseudouridine(55) synthase TruB [Promicromonospora citrea]GGM21827.1 tRNA pseudouridine synthase B [Promicromonospora citrea]